ncbi:MAG: ATP-binding protein [Pseudomonadota bacterium]
MGNTNLAAILASSDSLSGSRQFFDLVLSSSPDVVFVKDSEFRIVMANPAFLSLYPEDMRDKVIGFTTLEEYDEAQAEEFLTHDRVAFETGESSTIETIDFPDGKRRVLSTKKIRFEQGDGSQYIVGIGRDITDIVAGQEALAVSEERYELAVAGSAAGIWDWDLTTNNVFWSDRIKRQLGLAGDNGTMGIAEFIARYHPDDEERLAEKLRAHLQDREPYDVEFRAWVNGEYRWFRSCGQAVWDEHGQPKRMAGSLEDVTYHINAQEKLAQSMERLDEFAHIASHDLREPLRGIGSLVEFVKEDYGDTLPSDAVEQLDRITELKKRADTLVAELLQYSQLAHSEKRTDTVDLNALVAEAIRILPRDASHSVDVVSLLPTIVCEPVAIRQLFQNLITNGLKYNESANKRIEIGVIANDEDDPSSNETFFVKDNGIGIATKDQDKVFKIFQRLHGKTAFGGGTGAGLTFVKRIIERHNGTIWIESEPDEGSTFFFTLDAQR